MRSHFLARNWLVIYRLKRGTSNYYLRLHVLKVEEDLNDPIPTIIIASKDVDVIDIFYKASAVKDFRILVENEKLQTIWDTLDNMVVCLVLDLETFPIENLAFISIIKKIRPRLPVVVLSPLETLDFEDKLVEFGVFYRGSKPLCVQEVEQLIEGVDSIMMRNRDYLIASL